VSVIQFRRGTAAGNPVLAVGEPGYKTSTGEFKVGDGTTAWNSLPVFATTTNITAAVNAAVSGLVNGAPGALDTLKELADALGDDANFAATVTSALAAKAPLASPTFTGTVAGITKAHVGLGNADNTSDAAKPVSTAQAAADTAVATAATAALNTQVVSDVPKLLRPTTPTPTRFPVGSKLLQAFQSGHGWGLRSGSTGAVADDTTNFTEGTQSFDFTAATGTTTFVMSAILSPTIDLSVNSLVLKFRIDQWARLGGMYLTCTDSSATNFAPNRAEVSIASSASLIASDGEFVWVSVNPGDWATSGGFTAVNMAAVDRIGVYASGTGGTVQVNLQQLWTRPAPTAPCTIITFDDGYLTQFTNAKPYMDKYGFRGGLFPIRDLITGSGVYMSTAQLQAMYDSGWDISAHADLAASHNSTNALLDLSTSDGSASALSSFETELRHNKEWLLANGWTRSADFFAWPQGKFDAARLAIARKYFPLIRTYRPTTVVSDADTYPFVDGGRLRQIAVQSGGSPTSAATVTAALTAAWAAGHTVVLTFHGINSTSPQSYDYPVASFQTIIDHIATSGFPVKTLSAIMRDNGVDTPVSKSQLTAQIATRQAAFTGTPDGTKFAADDGTFKTPSVSSSLPSQTSNSGKFLTTDGTNPSWASTSSANVSAQLFTASGTYTAPATGIYRASAVGGGGGGGAGGSALTSGGVATQAAGAGGGSGEFVESVISLNSGDTLAVTIGTGGAGGTGGALNGNAGTGSAAGVNTTVVGTATLTARGGSAGGNGGANTVTTPNPGFYGSGGTTTSPGNAGNGGSTTTASGFQGGAGIGLVAKGGGGGTPANATNGGNGSSGAFSSGHTGTSTGGNGSAVTANTGAGGNGGGGGAPGGAGGNGSAGASGMVLITRIG
jgi:peptidoglycan/xylan/chitin deacetylase (PgdA/CDA1 family)